MLLGWFSRRCPRLPDPLLDLRPFTRTSFTAGIVAALAMACVVTALLLLLAQWLQLDEGHFPFWTGVHLLPLAAGAATASPVALAPAVRIGARNVLAGGLVVAAVGFLAFNVTPRKPGSGHRPDLGPAGHGIRLTCDRLGPDHVRQSPSEGRQRRRD
ncbi:hypothetical protein ACFT5C_27945 [Streptomyces sp. NPDC057116]|uniref:hypothetical protein n=1 Tax=Streptomyces sp. NPDC057116 TaxID=3346023 RepID=UPI00362C4E4A